LLDSVISEVAAGWHELMVLYPPMMQVTDIPPPKSVTLGFQHVVHTR